MIKRRDSILNPLIATLMATLAALWEKYLYYFIEKLTSVRKLNINMCKVLNAALSEIFVFITEGAQSTAHWIRAALGLNQIFTSVGSHHWKRNGLRSYLSQTSSWPFNFFRWRGLGVPRILGPMAGWRKGDRLLVQTVFSKEPQAWKPDLLFPPYISAQLNLLLCSIWNWFDFIPTFSETPFLPLWWCWRQRHWGIFQRCILSPISPPHHTRMSEGQWAPYERICCREKPCFN